MDGGCRQLTDVTPIMPSVSETDPNKPGYPFVQFTSHEKKLRAPFVIYADFEALTVPIQGCESDPNESYTQAYQKHEPSGYCYHIVSADPSVQFKPRVYRGPDCITRFILAMQKDGKALQQKVKEVVQMTITDEQEHDFCCATHCHLCEKPLGKDRVRDHDHLTGKYRGPAHSKCNLAEGKKRTKNWKCPVFFHNLKGYDAHHIMGEAGKHTSKLQAIPQNSEKLISFSFDCFRFLDSFGFLSTSLDNLVKNLYEGGAGADKFVHSKRWCENPEHTELILQKGVYAYDYINSWDRLDEKQLPPQSEFYSKLSEQGITDDQYKHAQTVWDAFECKTLGDYHDLYMLTDVLLLADVFESFRNVCDTAFELDPAHYFTTPNFAWDAMLKKTGVKLELLTDIDMHLMVEQGVRGGIAMISHRYAKANNPHLGESYDKDEEHSYIAYWDANNLYGLAMSQPLPIADFAWSQERDLDTLLRLYGSPAATGESQGCFVKCDIHYPKELHDLHNDYPLAPEQKLVTQDMLSPYAKDLQHQMQIGKDTCEKLVPNFRDKKDYVCDIRNLKYYVEKGLQVTKISKVITFTQKPWIQPYITFCTNERKKAKNGFEKDFWKLMCNSVFGKTMESLRHRVDIKFACSNSEDPIGKGKNTIKKDRAFLRNIANPLYTDHIIYSKDLAAIMLKKGTLVLNKPIYAGLSVLDLSKLHMYQFHYDDIKKKYGGKAKLLFTDTDSLCYHVQTDNLYADMIADKQTYDLSDMPAPYHDSTNKKVLGKFKDELEGKAAAEFIGLRPKLYSIQIGSEKKSTAKGVPGSAQRKITHQDYRRCLKGGASDQRQLVAFSTIRSKMHQLYTLRQQKVSLCNYDNKRYLLADGESSYAYGHWRRTEHVAAL